MEFNIPCEVFARMSNASAIGPDENRIGLNTIRIEHYNSNIIVVATNAKVLAVQNVGTTTQPNSAVNVMRLPELIEQCLKEAPYDGTLTIVDIPEMKFATAKTSFGYTYPGNVSFTFPDDAAGPQLEPWNIKGGWRSIVPTEQPKKSNGCMFMNVDRLVALGKAAPSQQLVFPNFIDYTKPVVVQDKVDKDWCGMFLPQTTLINKDVEAAVIPDWMQP